MSRKYDMTIGGQAARADTYVEVRNPANTDECVGLAPVGTSRHLDQAVDAARQAFMSWRDSSDHERRDACRAIANVITENADELAELLTKEQGKPLNGMGSKFEIGGCAAWADHTSGLSLPVKVLEASDANRIEMHRNPLGVVGSITPWNWPLMIAIWHVVPGIRTGNTVVIKPSPFTPLSTLRMVELVNEKLPPGLVNVVAGGDEVGAELASHAGIDKLVLTGSISTGKKVMRSASKSLTPVTLELGGNDAAVVLPGTDITPFVEGMFWGAMINSGQTCMAIKRLYVHDGDFDNVCKALSEFSKTVVVGNGMDTSTRLGPLQNERQFNRVIELVEDAQSNGATALTGGGARGGKNYFFPVTFMTGIAEGVRLVDEEQFGPVLPIIRYTDLDDAIARANGTDFGLGASVWGTDSAQTAAVSQRLEAGTVYINKHADIAPHVPLGGIKCSGIGVEFAEEGLAAYTSIKVINAPA